MNDVIEKAKEAGLWVQRAGVWMAIGGEAELSRFAELLRRTQPEAAPAQDLSAAILALDDLAVQCGAESMVSCMTHPKGPRTAVKFRIGDGSLECFAGALASSVNALSAGDRVDAELMTAAKAVVREALDNVCVHPCDQHNDAVKAKGLVEPVASLYAAILQSQKDGNHG